MPISFVLYRSETRMPPNSEASRQLLETARRVNAELDLTGFLHHEDGFFYHWLEGAAEPLAMICGRMERDPRHTNLTYLWRGTQDRRQFGGWRMGYSTSSDSSLLTWLANDPVAQRETRAYANTILSFLQHRNAGL